VITLTTYFSAGKMQPSTCAGGVRRARRARCRAISFHYQPFGRHRWRLWL